MPTHGQVVPAGQVNISANLVQGDIPVLADTIQVVMDGAAVSHQLNGGVITASAVLEPGAHTITVKGFDVNGRLISAKTAVTAAASAPSQ
ncbi:hypothetical protein D3C75_1256830 [compost metagenome]